MSKLIPDVGIYLCADRPGHQRCKEINQSRLMGSFARYIRNKQPRHKLLTGGKSV